MNVRPILVTGAAGFIGAALAHRLLDAGRAVVGLDNLNDYYDVSLKEARLARLTARTGFRFARLDLADRAGMAALFAAEPFDAIAHLGAQAGVRYSVTNPAAYVDSNLIGFANVLEGARACGARHLVFASTSSVYGANTKVPFAEDDSTDHPVSFYAATKKANEVMAHSYAWLHGVPCTGLRFFTVYGPWGRPDMSPMLFARAILAGEPIKVFNHGKMRRDFTYVDDIVEGVTRVLDHVPVRGGLLDSPATSSAPYRLYNIGNNRPVELLRYIEIMQDALGRRAVLDMQPLQPGDVVATAADIDDLEQAVGFRPSTPLEVGVPRFVEWYRTFHRV
jgi:UDP-glucuronate 4-epimerase